MKSNIYSLLCLLIVTTRAFALDEPDMGKELKFHKIYENYNSTPTPNEKWEPSAQKGKTQKYVIQKGDTLWDVSETLFGDGFFWSKVWSLNPEIKNPHEVMPGNEIHFTQGSGLSAPSLSVSKTEPPISTTPQLDKTPAIVGVQDVSKDGFKKIITKAEKEFKLENDDKIPPSKIKRNPVLTKFPQSIPDWKMEGAVKPPTVNIQLMDRVFSEASLILPYFISETEVPAVGKIHEMELTSKLAGVGDYLFIEGSDLKIGDHYTVFNSLGHVVINKESQTNPYMIQVQGEVQVVSQIENLFKAKVTKAVVPIEIRSSIMPGEVPEMTMSVAGSEITKDVAAEVVGGDFTVNRKLLGEQNILYLNKGFQSGVKVGSLLPLFATRQLRQIHSKIQQDMRQIGLVKVVRAEPNYSTALILWSIEEVLPGDTTSVGQVSGRAKVELEESLVKKVENDEDLTLDE